MNLKISLHSINVLFWFVQSTISMHRLCRDGMRQFGRSIASSACFDCHMYTSKLQFHLHSMLDMAHPIVISWIWARLRIGVSARTLCLCAPYRIVSRLSQQLKLLWWAQQHRQQLQLQFQYRLDRCTVRTSCELWWFNCYSEFVLNSIVDIIWMWIPLLVVLISVYVRKTIPFS